ncbi:MAG: cell wall-binding repeat-containing protein, partial [Candidatus Limnocylindria bacterium]
LEEQPPLPDGLVADARVAAAPVTDAAVPQGADGTTFEASSTTARVANGLTREVLGYLPYWELGAADLAALRYDLVSTIAYFGVAARGDGTLARTTGGQPTAGWAGWTSTAMTGVIGKAHDRGAKVVLTVTMMAWNGNYSAMSTLLNSAANRQRLIGELASVLKARGADGVNLDFEPVPTSLRGAYTAFVRQVKAGLAAAGAGSYVTVATMAGAASWSTGYDLVGLTAPGAADQIMVMGYDFSWSGSTRAGGVAPISNPYILDVSEAMAAHLSLGVDPSKIIWGVPYYGRAWNTTGNGLNSPVRSPASSSSVTYVGARSFLTERDLPRRWDPAGKVPWAVWWDSASNGYRQMYYDDAASLGAKYDLVRQKQMAGVGIWALGMDTGSQDLWNVIVAKFLRRDTRLAGADRYATAAALSRHAFPDGADVAYLATGASFPDALAGGGLAAGAGGPILLVTRTEIPAATEAELNRLAPERIVVLGGTSAVGTQVVTAARAHVPSGGVSRLAGADRYETAAMVSRSAFPGGADVAYLVTGADYPDALAAGVLAARRGGPVLLVRRGELPAATAAELARLGPAKITVIGGTGVVSDAVLQAARPYASGGQVSRLAGADRYATAAKVSAAVFPDGAPRVFVATGIAFPDALAAVPVAARAGAPLLLVRTDWVPDPTAAELYRLNPPSVLIVGSTSAISELAVSAIHEAFR